jgi:chaperonin GroES
VSASSPMIATWKDPSKPDGACNAHRDTCTTCRPGATPFDGSLCELGRLLYRRWWHWAHTGEDLPAETFAREGSRPSTSTASDHSPGKATHVTETRTPTTIRPLHDRILVKRIEAESKTSSGLIIPDNAKEKPVEGFVVAVGDGNRTKDGDRIPLDVRAGDRVLFSKYSGTEVKALFDGDEHLILREDDVLAVIG